jgi:hypothetical protein
VLWSVSFITSVRRLISGKQRKFGINQHYKFFNLEKNNIFQNIMIIYIWWLCWWLCWWLTGYVVDGCVTGTEILTASLTSPLKRERLGLSNNWPHSEHFVGICQKKKRVFFCQNIVQLVWWAQFQSSKSSHTFLSKSIGIFIMLLSSLKESKTQTWN